MTELEPLRRQDLVPRLASGVRASGDPNRPRVDTLHARGPNVLMVRMTDHRHMAVQRPPRVSAASAPANACRSAGPSSAWALLSPFDTVPC
jgi:hypothetical protein